MGARAFSRGLVLATAVASILAPCRLAYAASPAARPTQVADADPETVEDAPADAPADAAPNPEPETAQDAPADAAPNPEPKAADSAPVVEPEPKAGPPSHVAPPARPVAARTPIHVAVGLSPQAPGTAQERALLDALERSAAASVSPPATVRRLPLGSGSWRRVCRERRDDLVLMIGYVPSRARAVVLAHDCRLDTPLSVRGEAAAREVGLVGTLWDERQALVRGGMRERRAAARLSPRARGGIIAGVAIAAIAGAIGILVAATLREERVVVTVSP